MHTTMRLMCLQFFQHTRTLADMLLVQVTRPKQEQERALGFYRQVRGGLLRTLIMLYVAHAFDTASMESHNHTTHAITQHT